MNSKPREERIEHLRRYCTHYVREILTAATACCRAGINPRVRSGPHYKTWPCIDGHLKGGAAQCPRWTRVTAEQAEADIDRFDAQMQRTVQGIEFASTWKQHPKPKKDRYEVVECPACKGRLHLRQASSNGHCAGKCETPECVAFLE